MAYGIINTEFPSADLYKTSLRELIDYVKQLKESVDAISEEILAEAEKYTDEQLQGYQEQLEAYKREVNASIVELEGEFDALKVSINASLSIFDNRLVDLQNQLTADINAVNERTDLAIEQNNDYLLSEMSRYLSNILVLNYFTGEYITIQAMFDYLAQLHATDGITVSDLAGREKTVNSLIALNMTMTQLAMNGKNIIPA